MTLEEMNFDALDAYLMSTEPVADRKAQHVNKKRKIKSKDDGFTSGPLTPPVEHPNATLLAQARDSESAIITFDQEHTSTVNSKKVAKPKKVAASFYIDENAKKPESIGQPAVWADKRQQLTETLSWYKTNQASAYTNKNMVYGFLIDKAVSPRDIFNDDIIICTVYVSILKQMSMNKLKIVVVAKKKMLKVRWFLLMIKSQTIAVQILSKLL